MRNTRTRFFSILLTLCMVLTLLPTVAFAEYDDGDYCPFCGHYHWDDYMCSCGGCTDECDAACYWENHCPSCESCLYNIDYYCEECEHCSECWEPDLHCCECHACAYVVDICPDCGMCEDCIEDNGEAHCWECGACFMDAEICWDETGGSLMHCKDCCNRCDLCGKCYFMDLDGFCYDCERCIECCVREGSHCIACEECLMSEEACDAFYDEEGYSCCLSCCEDEGFHCSECGEHISTSESPDKWCEEGGPGSHCPECCDFCDSCDRCVISLGLDYCEDCGYCEECCLANSENEGCPHGICIASSEWDDYGVHRCAQCDDCFEESDFCEYCELCQNCCLENSESAGCGSGMCVEDPEWEDHICVDCDGWFEEDELCETCSDTRCLDCCAEKSNDDKGCSHGICMESSDWEEHYCDEHEGCIAEYCELCHGCKQCCDAERPTGCTHDFTCPNSSGWLNHFCKGDCGKCYELEDLCKYCGRCAACCAAQKPVNCDHTICVESPEWRSHYCFEHNKCLENCEPTHTLCSHANTGDYGYDAVYHWRVCEDCGCYPINKVSHTAGSWQVETPATETTDGLRVKKCLACGYTVDSKVIPAIGAHTCVASDTWMNDDTNHWKSCTLCGTPMDLSAHSITEHICTVCGYCDVDVPEIISTTGDIYVTPQKYEPGDQYAIFKVDALGGGLTYSWTNESDEEVSTGSLLRVDVNDLADANDEIHCNAGYLTYNIRVSNVAGDDTATVNLRVRHGVSEFNPYNATTHLEVCKDCSDSITGAPVPHRFAGGMKCLDCGYVKKPVIVTQPKSITTQIPADDSYAPVTFSVAASGEDLSYQWYYKVDGDENFVKLSVLSGTTYSGYDTSTLTVNVANNYCTEEAVRYFYCVVSNQNATLSADLQSVTSGTATLSVTHRYYPGWSHPLSSGTENHFDETHHWRVCCGSAHSPGTNVFEKAEHAFASWRVTTPATQSETGVKTATCMVCGYQKTETIPMLPADHVHTYDVYDYNSAQHWSKCGCGGLDSSSYAVHTFGEWAVKTPATQLAKGVENRFCSVCGYEDTRATKELAHTHTADSEWQKDVQGHWHNCTALRFGGAACTDKVDKAAHSYGAWVVLTPATADDPGQSKHTCTVCGYAQTVDTDKKMFPLTVTNGTSAKYAYKKGDTATVTAEALSGYTFDSWTVESGVVTLASATSKTTSFTMPGEEVTVKANYTYNGGGGGATTNYTLTFNVNGGSAISAVSKTSGTTVDLAGYTPTKTGYDFAGWYSDAALTAQVTSVKLTANTTVYAKWTEKTVTPDMPFTDVTKDDWFCDDVAYVFDKGLMQGTGTTIFSPYITTTHGMIVTILYRLEGEPTVSGTNPFDDVAAGKYYTNAIIWAAANKIVEGYGENKFGPQDNITREQMAAILWRYAKYKGYDISASADLSKFTDAEKICSYAVTPISWANANNLISGKGNGILDPGGNALRCEVAAILHRFCANIVK